MREISIRYTEEIEKAKLDFLKKLEKHGKAIPFDQGDYKMGVDSFGPPVSLWASEVFDKAQDNDYELSYNQMCKAFFSANEIMKSRKQD